MKRDKMLHLGVGALIGCGGSLFEPGLGLVLSVVAGLGKEVWDWRENNRALKADKPKPHTVEGADLVATVLGGLLGEFVGALLRSF